MTTLLKQTLSAKQNKKAQGDIEFISALVKLGREKDLRVIIHGGYATDAALGQITRPHEDIDIEIYGTQRDALTTISDLILSTLRYLKKSDKIEIIKGQGRREYYENFVIKTSNTTLDIYFTQTKVSPMGNEKIIIKSNGELSSQEFNPEYGHINGVTFEIQDPLTGVTDKIIKREFRNNPKLEKHGQDIYNLKLLVTEDEIEKKIKNLLED